MCKVIRTNQSSLPYTDYQFQKTELTIGVNLPVVVILIFNKRSTKLRLSG